MANVWQKFVMFRLGELQSVRRTDLPNILCRRLRDGLATDHYHDPLRGESSCVSNQGGGSPHQHACSDQV